MFPFQYSSTLARALVVALFCLAQVESQCPCPTQSNCQIVGSAQAVVKAKIMSQTISTTMSFTALVIKSYKGPFTTNQQISFSADPNCVKLRTGRSYMLSLKSQTSGWWLDTCGIHVPQSSISSNMWKTIRNYESECVPVCWDQSGMSHHNGTTWTVNPCQTCTCVNGFSNCTTIHCPPPPCNNSYVPNGQCCAICPQAVGQCISSGNIYENGQIWYVSPCRSCYCNNGQTICQDVQCPNTDCDDAYIPTGQCCPVCPQPVGRCLYEGIYYSNGQGWNPTPCKSCRCNNEITTCVTTICGQLPCNNSYTPQGQCCPVCPATNCYDQDGNTYYDGQIWKPLDCLTCDCSNGFLRCTSYNCVLPDCDLWYIPEGQCCPVCRT